MTRACRKGFEEMIQIAKENLIDDMEMRQAYGAELRRLMDNGEPVMALDADLMRAIGLLPYREQYPDSIMDCGIAEMNMAGVAAGLSSEGFIPFTHTFAAFASRRAIDQVFMSGAYAKMNVKVVGSDPGVTAALNGGTHQAFEDIAIMRAVPEMTIVEPSDAVMVSDLILKIAHQYGMFYIRLQRMKSERIYEPGSEFEIGKAVTVRDGKDITIIASGVEVVEAVQAAELLEKEGVSARVLDMFTIKPIDKEAVIAAAAETGAIVTAENHNIIGGLGSAVTEVLAENFPVPVERVGMRDRFGEVGPQGWLKEAFGLKDTDIVKAAKRTIQRKN